MAKTLEELKEAIQNVIAENDKGEITATSLNVLLTDMADTLSELGGSGDGGGCVYICLGDSLEEYTDPSGQIDFRPTIKKEETKLLNKKAYDTITEKLNNKEMVSVYLSMTEIYDEYAKLEGEVNPYSPYGFFGSQIAGTIITEDTLNELDDVVSNIDDYLGTIYYGILLEGIMAILFNDGFVYFMG